VAEWITPELFVLTQLIATILVSLALFLWTEWRRNRG
jgi:hypothetical protein